MSAIRLKVQLNDNKSSNDSFRKTPVLPLKFVYILNSPFTTTIDELKHLLEKYIIRQFSKTNIQIVRLMTDDGYYLSDDELCSNVFKDNERIICFDMESFVQENYSTLDLKNLWCEIKQHDASDNHEKYIQIGLNNSGKLFIRIHGTLDIYALYLFNVFQLIKIADEKSTSKIIARLARQNWFIEAKWEYDLGSNTILFLICSLKIGSSEQIWSKKIQLLLNESQVCIEKGEINYLSGEISDENKLTEKQLERLKELASNLPSPKRLGPEIDINKDADKTITKHECEGESLVRMAYGSTNTVRAYQDSYSSTDGTFRQHLVITHINFFKKSMDNHSIPIDKSISVVNIAVLYQTDDESWCECEDIAIAPIALRDEEPRWLADSIINIEWDKLVSYVIKGCINVKGEPGRDNARRKRVHKSLPQPLKLQIVIKDNLNKRCSLIVEQLNKSLDIDTSSSFAKYNQSSINELLAFVYADDCEHDERVFLAIYLNKENHIVIKSSQSYSITLERKYIRTMEFNAKQNNTTEVSFDSIYYQHGTQEKKAIGLFDSETFMFYAIRLEVTTKTSKSEETVILPLEKIE
jgi:hypothetical protein